MVPTPGAAGEDPGTERRFRAGRQGPDEIPDHAGGAPAVVVAHADDEAAGAPGQRDHAVAAGPGQLVRLGARVHDLEAVEPRGHQAVEPAQWLRSYSGSEATERAR